MTPEAEKRILAKFPKIFVQYGLPMTQTAMCWGLECGDGWAWLIEELCASLQWDIDNNKEPQVEASQVKEKYGRLCFYTGSTTDRQYGMIKLAEALSTRICELCGSPSGKLEERGGWWATQCDWCVSKEAARRAG